MMVMNNLFWEEKNHTWMLFPRLMARYTATHPVVISITPVSRMSTCRLEKGPTKADFLSFLHFNKTNQETHNEVLIILQCHGYSKEMCVCVCVCVMRTFLLRMWSTFFSFYVVFVRVRGWIMKKYIKRTDFLHPRSYRSPDTKESESTKEQEAITPNPIKMLFLQLVRT